jgi:RNA polymerase sigma-70 factor (family 1)
MEDYQEKELVEDFIKGDAKAFNALYNRYFERLYVFAVDLIANQPEAKDIIIQTFAKLFDRYPQFSSLPGIRSFLYTSVRNAGLDYLKHQKRLTARQERYKELIISDSNVVNASISGEMIAALYASLEKLPDGSRMILKMIYIDGLKYKEVADQLHISISTVKSQRLYALAKLRQSFSRKDLFSLWVLGLSIEYFK